MSYLEWPEHSHEITELHDASDAVRWRLDEHRKILTPTEIELLTKAEELLWSIPEFDR